MGALLNAVLVTVTYVAVIGRAPHGRIHLMNFTGREHHGVDAKGRASMPARFRDVIFETATAAEASRLVIVPWFGECVRVFPVARWRAHMARLEARLIDLDSFGYGEDESDLRRLIYGLAIEVPMDGHGRFVLPQHVRDEAGIEREAFWLGLGDYLELWRPERLQDRLSGDNARRLRARLVELLVGGSTDGASAKEENSTPEDALP